MIRALLLAAVTSFTMSSCLEIDEQILPIVGIYRAHVVGVAGPFDLIVTTDRGDNIIMETPFDGFDWYTIKVDVDNQQERLKDLNIFNQNIGSGISIKGGGFFRVRTIELRYTMNFGGEKVNYVLVGTKY